MSIKKCFSLAAAAAMFFVVVFAASAQSNTCTLTVKTTANNGTVWGTVMASYGGKTVRVSKAMRKLSVPCGTKVTLTEMPTKASSWKFKSWASQGAYFSNPSSSTVHFTMNGSTTVAAHYKKNSSSSSSSSSSSWG